MYKLKDLCNSNTSTQLPNGDWVPARGENHKFDSFKKRLKDAWCVFTRKADAFTWPEDDYNT